MLLSDHMCSEVNFPLCKILNLEITKWASGSKRILFLNIQSPYTVAIFIIAALCVIRMINHVNSLHSSIGRGEMRIIFSLFIISSFLQAIIIGLEEYLNSFIFEFLVVLQLGTFSATFFALFVSGFTIQRIYGLLGMESATFAGFVTLIYFISITSLIFLGINNMNALIFPIILLLNTICLMIFIWRQIVKLNRIKSDIWAYGILSIICLFYSCTIVCSFSLAKVISIISERNLDNLFFISTFTFITIMMIHKYWLSTCDFEIECLSLPC